MELAGRNPNRDRIIETARRITPLLETVVFVGGSIVDLLITDPAAFRSRPTDDVDVVVGCTSRVEYHGLLTRLRLLGFHPDTRPDAPVCRTRTTDGYVLDVMPLDEQVLGFSNRWYALVLDRAEAVSLTADLTIRLATPSTFFLTKWEAFETRGAADPLRSRDLEDVIMVVAGRRELLHELRDLPDDARVFLRQALDRSLARTWFRDAVEGATPDARMIPGLATMVYQRFEAIRDLLNP